MNCHVVIGQCSLEWSTAIAFFARGGLHVLTCDSPCANRAVLSRLSAAIVIFAHERSHVISFDI